MTTTLVREARAGAALDGVASRIPAIAPPLLLGIGAVIALLLFVMPPYPSDQLNYFNAARDFPSVPDARGIIHQYARVGIVLPMAVAIEVLGYSQAAYYVVPLTAAVALALAVYALGALLFARVVGLAAAVLAVGNTTIFMDGSAPLPDLPAAALFAWAVVVAFAIRVGHPLVSGSSRRRVVALIGLGVLLGWSYLAREFMVFVWPLIPVILFRRVAIRELAWIAAPLAVIGLGELLLNAVVFGDPLARVRVASEHGSGPIPPELAATYQNKEPIWYLAQVAAAVEPFQEGDYLKAALLVAVVGGLMWPRQIGVFVLWMALLYVPLVLLGGLLNPDAPMLRLFKVRYWYPIFPAFLIGAIATTWLAARAVADRLHVPRPYGAAIAAALAVTVGIAPVVVAQTGRNLDVRYRANGATHMEELRAWLATSGQGIAALWTDERSARVTHIFTSGPVGGSVWAGEIRILPAGEGATKPAPGDHVLLYSARSGLCADCRIAAEEAFGSPVVVPDTWSLAFATGDRRLEIYEVP